MKKLLTRKRLYTMMLVASASLIGGCGSDSDSTEAIDPNYYDGVSDGLLGGLGLSGIQGGAPGYLDAENPTKAELRKNAIHANYTALVAQGDGLFGVEYGPSDDTQYAGYEYLAYVGEGLNRAIVMVQIPNSFNVEEPCIVAGPASGSRGVYGAIGTAGAWGLEKGCAVAYTDMNKGTGAVDLSQGKGYGINLEALDLDTTQELTFRVPTQENITAPSAEYAGVELPSEAEVTAYIAANPNRYAFKHAHSQKNTEKDWGKHTLQSIDYAFTRLNKQFPQNEFTPENTMVIAASVSNGGSGVLRAAELDTLGLIDAVVAGEPNVMPVTAATDFSIRVGEHTITNHSKTSYEYFTTAELYAACATDDPANAGTALPNLRGDVTPRCDALVQAGLLDAGTEAEVGAQASAKLVAAGFTPESLIIASGYGSIDIYQSLVTTYANQYTRSSLVDSLCDVSMGAVDDDGAPAENTAYATLATTSNGIPRTANLVLIKDNDNTGAPIKQHSGTSANGTQDYNLEGALCYWDLFDNAENPLHARLMNGISEVKASGDLQGKPTIIIHGRSDALIVANHSSRPYLGLNKQVEGENSNLKYYEVTNAQHLDTLNQSYIAWGGVGMSFVPIDYYFKQAADLMFDHLKNGTALPASQVVKALAPTDGVLAKSDLTAIQATPENPITFDGVDVVIPE